MARICVFIALALITVSWVAAVIVGLAFEYAGWHQVFVEHNIAAGLGIAFLAAPPAFMLTQTVFGLMAAPFGLLAERYDHTGETGLVAD